MATTSKDVAACVEILKRVGALYEEGGTWYLSAFRVSVSDDSISAEASRCYELLVRHHRKCLVKDHSKSSRRHPVYVVSVDCLLDGTRQPQPPQYTLSDVLREADRRFGECPLGDVPAVRRAYRMVREFLAAVASGRLEVRERHVLLVGPPGTGKSLVLSMFDHPAAPVFYGATTSPRAIAEYLLGCPAALVRVDELDKASKRTVDALLHILSDGRLVVADARGRVEVRVDVPVLAAANRDFDAKRSESWTALLDRFTLVAVELGEEDWRALEGVVRAEMPEIAERVMAALRSRMLSLRVASRYIALWRAGLREHVLSDLESRTAPLREESG